MQNSMERNLKFPQFLVKQILQPNAVNIFDIIVVKTHKISIKCRPLICQQIPQHWHHRVNWNKPDRTSARFNNTSPHGYTKNSESYKEYNYMQIQLLGRLKNCKKTLHINSIHSFLKVCFFTCRIRKSQQNIRLMYLSVVVLPYKKRYSYSVSIKNPSR